MVAVLIAGYREVSAADQAATISGFAFAPGAITVQVGDTVTWTNRDEFPHTVSSDTPGVFDSGSMGNGGTFSHTFAQAGTFAYHCNFHPDMTASVTVQGQAATATATAPQATATTAAPTATTAAATATTAAPTATAAAASPTTAGSATAATPIAPTTDEGDDEDDDDGGSNAGLVIGGILVVAAVLGGGAWLVMRRR